MRASGRRLVGCVASITVGLGLALGGTTGTAGAESHSQSAGDTYGVCVHDHRFLRFQTRGQRVWIPTNVKMGNWQQGGSQSITFGEGDMLSVSEGSTRGESTQGGLTFGPFGVSRGHDEQFSSSTTSSHDVNRSWQRTLSLADRGSSRGRLYHLGWRFPYQEVHRYVGGRQCKDRINRRIGVMPVGRRNLDTTAWLVERFAARDQVRPL